MGYWVTLAAILAGTHVLGLAAMLLTWHTLQHQRGSRPLLLGMGSGLFVALLTSAAVAYLDAVQLQNLYPDTNFLAAVLVRTVLWYMILSTGVLAFLALIATPVAALIIRSLGGRPLT